MSATACGRDALLGILTLGLLKGLTFYLPFMSKEAEDQCLRSKFQDIYDS